ncbi:sulfotransferase domain-containing protein [Nereida sp. MMG025]|uniref:sulfotransferase domain-containing protein n=1 Tax=Nereida sp. MMG025 TaxID=2909981 RepID=UPI00351D66CF|nr:sulfotransferase domain-containing protein [Nereida sp. MMG025]
MTNDKFPGFFIIGAPKCGTTTLFDWLNQHPDTYLTDKEPSFFSQDIVPTDKLFGMNRTLDDYLSLICPDEAAGRMTGEATPKYLYSDHALEVLSQHKDRIRIVVTLRNPVDLCISLHGQFLKQGVETEANFEKAWNNPHPTDIRRNYAFWGQFGERLEKVFSMFDAEQVLVLILEEEMSKSPQKAYSRLVDFLGLSQEFTPNLKVSNPAQSISLVWLNGLGNRARRRLARTGLRFSGTGVLKLLARANRKRAKHTSVSPELRKEMTALFASDVDRVAQLLGRDSLPWPDFFETGERTDEA